MTLCISVIFSNNLSDMCIILHGNETSMKWMGKEITRQRSNKGCCFYILFKTIVLKDCNSAVKGGGSSSFFHGLSLLFVFFNGLFVSTTRPSELIVVNAKICKQNMHF